MSGATADCISASLSIAAAIAASRPRGARIKARSEIVWFTRARSHHVGFGVEQRRRLADKGRYAAQHALEIGQRLAERDAAAIDAELADRILVRAGALLDHGNR